MTHFLLTTMFTSGDVVPFVRLGARLLTRGHRVTLVTHEPYRALALDAGLQFASWDTADEHAALMADGTLFNDIAGFSTMYERHVLPKLAHEAAALRAHADNTTIIVTRCGPALAARAVASERDIPLIELYLGPGHVSPSAVVAEFVRPFSAPIAELRGNAHPLDPWVMTASARVGVWPAWFAARAPHWPADLELTSFIDGGDGGVRAVSSDLAALLGESQRTILLASGTGRFLTRDVVDAAAGAARRLDVRLLLVTPFDELVPTPLPSHVHWLRSAPYSYVMPRVSLVIHHGGIGTTVEALRAGVPQVVLGAGGDRPVNAACLVALGVGSYVPPGAWSEDAVATAAGGLLDSAACREMCATIAARLAAEDAEVCVRPLEQTALTGFATLVEQASRSAPAKETADDAVRARLARLTPEQRSRLLKRVKGD